MDNCGVDVGLGQMCDRGNGIRPVVDDIARVICNVSDRQAASNIGSLISHVTSGRRDLSKRRCTIMTNAEQYDREYSGLFTQTLRCAV